jgi:hypothetical protein
MTRQVVETDLRRVWRLSSKILKLASKRAKDPAELYMALKLLELFLESRYQIEPSEDTKDLLEFLKSDISIFQEGDL